MKRIVGDDGAVEPGCCEVEAIGSRILKMNTADTVQFLNDESLKLCTERKQASVEPLVDRQRHWHARDTTEALS